MSKIDKAPALESLHSRKVGEFFTLLACLEAQRDETLVS